MQNMHVAPAHIKRGRRAEPHPVQRDEATKTLSRDSQIPRHTAVRVQWPVFTGIGGLETIMAMWRIAVANSNIQFLKEG